MFVDDFDGDAYLDIIVSNRESANIIVFLGNGNGLFENQIIHAVDFRPSMISGGDFNNDGLFDIVVEDDWNNYIHVLLHSTMGGFGNGISFASDDGSHLRHVAVSDFNKDDQLDIIIDNFGTDSIGILFGQFNGQFQAQETVNIGSNSHPHSLAIGDFNGDGLQDIAVANSGTKSITMFLGNRQRIVVHESDYEPIYDSFPSIVVAGNFNDDQRSDIVIAYNDADNVDMLISYDTGILIPQEKYSTGQGPNDIASGDFNNDTYQDIAVVNQDSNSLRIFLEYINGSFANPITHSTGINSEPVSLAVGHLNKDFSLDIVTVNYGTGTVDVFLGLGNSSFIRQNRYSADHGVSHVVVEDLNNDGCTDIVVGNVYGDRLVILLGHSNGSFSKRRVASTGSDMYKLAISDLNNDNYLDLVIINQPPNTINIFSGYGNGSFHISTIISTDRDPLDIAVEDFNHDNYQDIAVIARAMDGDNISFVNSVRYTLQLAPNTVVVGDMNDDSHVDIVITFVNSRDIAILFGYGDGSFRHQIICDSGSLPNSATIGDFNNDGRLDLVITDSTSNHIGALLGYSRFSFVHQMTLHTGYDSQLQAIVVDDFNNDHRMDIVVANSKTNHISVFTDEGNDSFANQTVYSTGTFPCSLAAGYFNNDTYLDIVVSNRDNDTVSVFFGYGNGSFSNQVMYFTGIQSQPISVAVADFNNDSFVDIIVMNRGAHNVGILLGNGKGNFSEIMTFSTSFGSFPFSFAMGDFNNDRKVDFVVANEGSDSLKLFLQTC